jgi:hypothetical protein
MAGQFIMPDRVRKRGSQELRGANAFEAISNSQLLIMFIRLIETVTESGGTLRRSVGQRIAQLLGAACARSAPTVELVSGAKAIGPASDLRQ